MSHLLIACGGTGGHLAPGIALAETLQARGHTCTLLISQKQIDSVLIKKYSHLDFHKVAGQGFAGGLRKRLLFFWSTLSGILQSYRLLGEKNADFVVLFGGYLSVGLGLAAWFKRVPIALHEANCVPGRSIRSLQRLATRVYLPEGIDAGAFPSSKVKYLGYPVRNEIKHSPKAEAQERLGIKVKDKLLVIIGGSQGATALNQWVVNNLEALRKLDVSVYCVTGLGKRPEIPVESDDNGNSATFVTFSDQMGDVISAADLIISRAGAGSIAEITRCRAPAILIPYPYAADDHQQANARMHEQQGAGVVVNETDLDKLLAEVERLMHDNSLLETFKSSMEKLNRIDPAVSIAEDIEGILAD